jgi:hypothetical protein
MAEIRGFFPNRPRIADIHSMSRFLRAGRVEIVPSKVGGSCLDGTDPRRSGSSGVAQPDRPGVASGPGASTNILND